MRVTTWQRQLSGDLAWLCGATLFALLVGTAGDQLFRHPRLGWHHHTAAERILAAGAESMAAGEIDIVTLDALEPLMGRPEIVLLDARPRLLFELGHLPGARNLPREELESELPRQAKDLAAPARKIIVYCSDADCEDGVIVAQKLRSVGYRSVSVFPGGFAEWEESGQLVEKSP